MFTFLDLAPNVVKHDLTVPVCRVSDNDICIGHIYTHEIQPNEFVYFYCANGDIVDPMTANDNYPSIDDVKVYLQRTVVVSEVPKAEVPKAMDTITRAMNDDDNPSEQGSYAHSWHCNIKMMCYDAIMANDKEYDTTLRVGHKNAMKIGEDAASRVMKLCFGITTQG